MSMTDLYHTEMLNNKSWKSASWSAIPNYDEWKSSDGKVDAEALWPEYRSIKFLLEQRDAVGELEFAQEYLADFNVYEGQVWNFNHERCVADLSELDTSQMDMFAGLDVGYKDPTAFCVIGYDWDKQKFYLVDEYLDAERTTEQHAIEIRKLMNKWDIDWIYIDSAAQQTRYDFAQNFDITTINAKKSVLDGIGHVAGIVDNETLLVDQRCFHTIQAIDQYQWDPNPKLMREKPKHDQYSHMADALRYALYTFETVATTF